ncbi:uncharacterized [Tachysurus ichikawai]
MGVGRVIQIKRGEDQHSQLLCFFPSSQESVPSCSEGCSSGKMCPRTIRWRPRSKSTKLKHLQPQTGSEESRKEARRQNPNC